MISHIQIVLCSVSIGILVFPSFDGSGGVLVVITVHFFYGSEKKKGIRVGSKILLLGKGNAISIAMGRGYE